MERYTVDGLVLGGFSSLDKEARDQQWKLIETFDNILYYHFDGTRFQSNPKFCIVINGVELECEYRADGNQIWYITTRTDTQKQERYLFMVEPDDIYDSVLSDDITQARLVTLWLVAGWHFQ